MSSFLDRIDHRLLLEAGPDTPEIIDINNQRTRMEALRSCRAPCVGWDDYVAGNDYQPPCFYTSDVPYGPEADLSANPHAEKYGGVRPWNPNEVMATLIYPLPLKHGKDLESVPRTDFGLIWTIARKPRVERAFLEAGQPFDVEEAVAVGVHAALYNLHKDQGRRGTRFTSFLGHWIEAGMVEGVSPSFNNEYREFRGAIAYLVNLTRAAKRELDAGGNTNNIVDELQELRTLIDPVPGPKNQSIIRTNNNDSKAVSLGALAPDLINIIDEMIESISSNDPQEVANLMASINQKKEEAKDLEDQQTIRSGKTSGTIPTRKDMGMETKQYVLTRDKLREAKEFADKAWHAINNGLDYSSYPNAIRSVLLNDKGKPYKPKDFGKHGTGFEGRDSIFDVIMNLADVVNTGDQKALSDSISGLVDYMDTVDSSITKRPGFETIAVGGDDGDRETERLDMSVVMQNPEHREFVERAVRFLRTGIGSGAAWAGKKAISAIETMRNIISMVDAPPAQRQYKIVPSEAEPGFDVVDSATGDVVGGRGHDTEAEAIEQLNELQQSRLLRSAQAVRSEVTSDYGEYAEEIRDLSGDLITALQNDNVQPSMFSELSSELDMLEKVAREDMESGQTVSSTPSVTPQEYRVLIRKLGLKNYPERGTVDDPEIDENGNLSQWAREGYPSVESNTEIKRDLGISSVRISQLWGGGRDAKGNKKIGVRDKLGKVLEAMGLHLSESGEIGRDELRLIYELRAIIGRMIVEELVASEPIFG